jgi:hypothetical protein
MGLLFIILHNVMSPYCIIIGTIRCELIDYIDSLVSTEPKKKYPHNVPKAQAKSSYFRLEYIAGS